MQADKTGQGAIQMWKVGEDLYTLMGMEWALFCLGIILIVAVLAQGRSRVVVGGAAAGVILSAVVVGAVLSVTTMLTILCQSLAGVNFRTRFSIIFPNCRAKIYSHALMVLTGVMIRSC